MIIEIDQKYYDIPEDVTSEILHTLSVHFEDFYASCATPIQIGLKAIAREIKWVLCKKLHLTEKEVRVAMPNKDVVQQTFYLTLGLAETLLKDVLIRIKQEDYHVTGISIET